MSAERLRAVESKSQRAYRFLRERIDDGRYVPGYRLVLGQVAAELDVSVVPVREAIRRLEAEGLVTFERNVGAQVALLEETEYLHTMQTLALVEGAATRLSAPHLTPDHLRRAWSVTVNIGAHSTTSTRTASPSSTSSFTRCCSRSARTRTSSTSCTAAGTG